MKTRQLIKKELKFYLNTLTGYVLVSLFAVLVNIFFLKDLFAIRSFQISNFFSTIPWIFVFFIPALTMRSLSEEKKNNTFEVLLSLPVKESQIVLSKFWTALILVIVGLVLTFPALIFVKIVSNVYLLEILSGLLGVVLIASAFISFSLFVSSLTDSYVVSFLISSVALMFLMFFQSSVFEGVISDMILRPVAFLLPYSHYLDFTKGLVELDSVIYFLSFSFVFLVASIINLERKN
ncbi:MAG: ABC transporter permease [Patescibacteria group bacterium]|nr:MAG: ABC transporter permease [Patescibacteria group bacterium]